MNKRHLLFLKDVIWFTCTAFGGAQAHIGMMLSSFVQKRHYISKEELLELNALTQILPGPSSTQTLVGVGYKVGGLPIALITFLIWIFPSAAIMCFAAISYTMLGQKDKFDSVLKFIQPVAVGIVAYAAFSLGKTVLNSKIKIWLAVASVIATLILSNAYIFPILILLGGIISSSIDTPLEESELRFKLFSKINPQKISYFIGILLLFAALGALINRTSPFSLPIRLFENFYRNGIMIFGGGQVLVPFMFTEFVEMKQYITSKEFIAGFALQQAIPGPTFSFTSYIGTMTMKNSGYGSLGQILGSIVAVLGINLPGIILVLFIVPFWNDLKKITRIKNSLSGINAVSVGFMVAAFVLLLQPMGINFLSISIVAATFFLLLYTKIKTPALIFAGVLLGILF
ncbi:chromate efflux transporter [Daejeonella oryzae]|uniref:chromate efflux transporter n=1 Tax=Daejeonella oryzae TaxID=1122943 RepID=UPI00041692C5|nr:chromate efflux transporter [Daejeonella oryzae]